MKPTPLQINPRRHNLHFPAPATRWDEGLPLGNGLLGLLVWGDGHPLNLSVDRSDLWDNRPDPKTRRPEFNWKHLTELVDRGDMQAVRRVFEGAPVDTAIHPTKLPCGRLCLEFAKRKTTSCASHLDFATAMATVRLGRTIVTAYVHATRPLVVVRGRGRQPGVNFRSAFDTTRQTTADAVDDHGGAQVRDLGYPPLQKGRCAAVAYLRQPGRDGFSFTVAWVLTRTNREWALYLTVQSETAHRDPLLRAIQILEEAQAAGPVRLEKSHRAWWERYWRRGHIALPDKRLEHLWYAEMYKLGAAARENTPPISLQGVWTADEQKLPPWRGDYHHDLNTQMTYWPVHTAGRLPQSRGFAQWLHSLLPKYRKFARQFYGAPGANAPCSHGLTGEIIPGWAAFVYSRTNIAWLVQHLWWHWRYTLDQGYLRDLAYPVLREVARFCASQLELDAHGVYHLRYSSSPEYPGEAQTAFGTDSTYDLANIRYALATASAAAKLLGRDRRLAREWDRLRAQLAPYHVSPERQNWCSPERGLALWEGQALRESHRHLAQCMPIFPLGDVNIEGGERDRELIRHTLYEIECQGTGFWCGYSFAWLACLAARVRQPRRGLWSLNQYLDSFVSPNTFHLNGDFRETGASRFHYRPFTLEGGFGAAHAVNEMLLQSWGDKLRLFPAVPDEWQDVAFTDLRGEGAFVVSAWRQAGEFRRAEIVSEKGTPLRLEHPHHRRTITVTPLRKTFVPGHDIAFPTSAGQRYTLTVGSASPQSIGHDRRSRPIALPSTV